MLYRACPSLFVFGQQLFYGITFLLSTFLYLFMGLHIVLFIVDYNCNNPNALIYFDPLLGSCVVPVCIFILVEDR